MSRRNLYWLLAITALTVFGLAISHPGFGSRERDRDYENVKLLLDIFGQVRKKYAKELSPERERQLVEDMINGGLERLDPHSTYINPKEFKAFRKQSEGKFGGIGIQLGYDRQSRKQLTVVTPMFDTPAYNAGILAGDRILKIEGKSTEGMKISDAVELIQGDAGQKLSLTVQHEGSNEPVDVELTRAEIHVSSVLGDLRKKDSPGEWDLMLDHAAHIGYLRITNFAETTTTEVKSAVDALIKQGVRGLILDLRGNPGGLLRSAVDISDLFLSEGAIVTTRSRDAEETHRAQAEGTRLLPAERHPIVILVNRASASASEILAAALQDHGRAIVIGERTYGKGSVQTMTSLEQQTSALKLTTASYWRPNGKNIHRFPDSTEKDDWGVKPNDGFDIPMTEKESLDYLTYRSDRDVIRPKDARPEEKPYTDKVLARALEHIKAKLADVKD